MTANKNITVEEWFFVILNMRSNKFNCICNTLVKNNEMSISTMPAATIIYKIIIIADVPQ